jgi:hypothetical protein
MAKDWDGSWTPAHRANRDVVDDFGVLVKVRRCSLCRRWLEASIENYSVRNIAKGDFQHNCLECRRVRARIENISPEARERRRLKRRAQYRKDELDAERVAYRRARQREAQRRWRARHPERAKEVSRNWREREKADPKKRKRYIERNRMRHYLQREREGKPLVIAERLMSSGRGPELIAEPLHEKAVRFAAQLPEWMTEADKSEVLGISDKTLREWSTGRGRKMVRADVAERVIIGMEMLWFDVWEKPANGHKDGRPADVLRYIDDANVYIAACLAFEGELVE